jgi:acyl-CoA reductase-like NAD-dependent aldehyde dehydrogenase
MAERIPVLQDREAVHRRRVPTLRVGTHLRGHRADGAFLANAALASRKDVRDAVVAARAAQPGWAARPPTTAARCCTASPS